MHDQLIHDLTRRRKELTCDLNTLLDRIGAIRSDIEHIDSVMVMFRPDIKPEAIPSLKFRKKADWARRGEITRHVFEALRGKPDGLTTAEVTDYVIQARGIEIETAKQRKRVYKSLHMQWQRGKLIADRSNSRIRWMLPD